VSSGASGTQDTRPGQFDPPWTIRGLIAGHKRASLFSALALAVMVGLIAIAMLGGTQRTVTDATTCTAWASANVDQQHTYAQLYVREHGAVPRWGTAPVMVIGAINAGCFQAYGEDVDDTTTVVQAISGNF
jgi:hypothetical protein